MVISFYLKVMKFVIIGGFVVGKNIGNENLTGIIVIIINAIVE